MEDAEWALDCGADSLGFVFEPSSPRYVGDKPEAGSIPHRFGLFARCIAVFASLPQQYRLPIGYAAVQATAGDNYPDNHWWIRAIRQAPGMTVERALSLGEIAQALLIDAYDPVLHGGTGKTADWQFASELVRSTAKPTYLAGGLTTENVATAIALVQPYGVDVSSGVEASPGIKDPIKVKDFIQAAKG